MWHLPAKNYTFTVQCSGTEAGVRGEADDRGSRQPCQDPASTASTDAHDPPGVPTTAHQWSVQFFALDTNGVQAKVRDSHPEERQLLHT